MDKAITKASSMKLRPDYLWTSVSRLCVVICVYLCGLNLNHKSPLSNISLTNMQIGFSDCEMNCDKVLSNGIVFD